MNQPKHLFTYELVSSTRVLKTCTAESLTEAIPLLLPGTRCAIDIEYQFSFMAVLSLNGGNGGAYGVRWSPVATVPMDADPISNLDSKIAAQIR